MTDYKGSLHFSSSLPSVTDFILFYYQQTLPLRLGKPLVDPDFLPFRSKKKHLFYSCSCILTPKLLYNWLCWNHMSIPGPTSDLRGMDGMIGCSVGHRLSPVLSLGYSTVIGVQHCNPTPDKGKEFPKGKWRSGFKKKKKKANCWTKKDIYPFVFLSAFWLIGTSLTSPLSVWAKQVKASTVCREQWIVQLAWNTEFI